MPLSVTIPDEYGYVLLAATSTAILNTWIGGVVGSYRRAAKVPYPNAYASAADAAADKDKYMFNCAQRAHGNFLEAQPSLILTLLISGLKYPIASAALGATWTLSRMLYTWGYLRRDKEGGSGRYAGILHMPVSFALIVMSGIAGWGLLAK